MIGSITLDIFSIEVGIFETDADRIKSLEGNGLTDLVEHDVASYASAHQSVDKSGRSWFSMVIKPEANLGTIAHECVHIADFVMDLLGIPTGAENTEVRAYIVGHLFNRTREIIGGDR